MNNDCWHTVSCTFNLCKAGGHGGGGGGDTFDVKQPRASSLINLARNIVEVSNSFCIHILGPAPDLMIGLNESWKSFSMEKVKT